MRRTGIKSGCRAPLKMKERQARGCREERPRARGGGCGRWTGTSSLVQRLQLHHGRTVVGANPEGDWGCGVVDEDSANVRESRQQIFHELAGRWIQALHGVGELSPGPGFAVLVGGYVVGPGPGGGRFPLFELL